MGKGWYVLVGITAALIALLVAFAVWQTYQSRQDNCAPGFIICGSAPR